VVTNSITTQSHKECPLENLRHNSSGEKCPYYHNKDGLSGEYHGSIMSIKYYSCDMAELFLWREEGECHGMIEKCHHQGTPLAQFLKFLVWVTVRLHSPLRLA
jgi:hypothetical protein